MATDNSSVIQLQQMLLDSRCSVTEILRLAKIIASELEIEEFEKWISCELNGYFSDDIPIPQYRTISTFLMYFNPFNGWQPAMIANKEIEHTIATKQMRDAIHAYTELANIPKDRLAFPCNGEQNTMLNRLFSLPFPASFAQFYSHNQIEAMVQSVKDQVLNWTINLKKQRNFRKRTHVYPTRKRKCENNK